LRIGRGKLSESATAFIVAALGNLKHQRAVEQINSKVERQFTSRFIPACCVFFFISKVQAKNAFAESALSDEFKSAIKGQSTSHVCVCATLWGERAKNQVVATDPDGRGAFSPAQVK